MRRGLTGAARYLRDKQAYEPLQAARHHVRRLLYMG